MKFVNFESELGNCIAVVVDHIVALQQTDIPTNLPTIVYLVGGQMFAVRNTIDVCLKRISDVDKV